MANSLRIKRGTKATIPTLAAGEPGWTTDTFELFVGDGTTNRSTTPAHYPTKAEIQNGGLVYAADAGTTDAYAITLSPAPAAYTTGMVVHFKANTINTGICTLNVNALGIKTIKKQYNVDLNDGDIKAGQLCSVIYDGINFQLLSSGGIPYSGASGAINLGVNNLTVDTDTLFIDSVNHRIGIGTTSPGAKLEVAGNVLISGANGLYRETFMGVELPARQAALLTNQWNAALYQSWSDVGAYPFNSYGNLIIQPRTSANADIVFATGATTPTVKMVINNLGNVGIGTVVFGTSITKGLGMGLGTAPTTFPADMAQQWVADIVAGNAAFHFGTEAGHIVKLFKGAALTTQLTSITATAPGTPDYAIADLTQTTPFGFVSADEGQTVLKVILNLQTRVAELEARLQASGQLT